jgi:hypothetical protein
MSNNCAVAWKDSSNISSITIDHDELFEFPGYSGRAGRN